MAATKCGRNFIEPTLGPSFKQPITLPVFAKRVSAQGMAVHKMQRRPSSRIADLYHQADTPHHVRTLEVQGVHQLHQLKKKQKFCYQISSSEVYVVYCNTSLLLTKPACRDKIGWGWGKRGKNSHHLVSQVYELLQSVAGSLSRARKTTACKKAMVDSFTQKNSSSGMLQFVNLLSFGTLNDTIQADLAFAGPNKNFV